MKAELGDWCKVRRFELVPFCLHRLPQPGLCGTVFWDVPKYAPHRLGLPKGKLSAQPQVFVLPHLQSGGDAPCLDLK